MFSSYSDSDHNNVGAKLSIIAKASKEEKTSIASFPEPRPKVCTAMVSDCHCGNCQDDNSGFYWG